MTDRTTEKPKAKGGAYKARVNAALQEHGLARVNGIMFREDAEKAQRAIERAENLAETIINRVE
jgi:hypothetical protein